MNGLKLFYAICLTVSAFTLSVSAKGAKETLTLKDADGNVYATVKIGGQVWMAENLRTTKYNDGTPIPLVTDATKWTFLPTPAYCYYENAKKADVIRKNGALYNWYVIGTNKLVPPGWHVPTSQEFETLQKYLIANGHNWDGSKKEDKTAKSWAAKTGWEEASTNGEVGKDPSKNNKSGFSGAPSGYRDDEDGHFSLLGENSFWWTVTEGQDGAMDNWGLVHNADWVRHASDLKSTGCSIRLIKD
jgi:uncharacterized protein (TIGR02145 family)